MPKADKQGHARDGEIPATLERSPQKAQDTFAQTYDAALDQYHDEERAARAAWAAVKHTHEKVGDHWEPKDRDDWGASDEPGSTHGGVDANATKEHLHEIAQRLDIEGRSTMSKSELVDAINAENQRRTREASGRG